MRILLVVTSANDVFIYNFAKWLKESLDCTLDAFELYPSTSANQENSQGLFNTIESADWKSWWGKNKVTRFFFSPFMLARRLNNFVNDKQYDVIQVHGMWFYVPFANELINHTKKLYISFWGSEFNNGKVWQSHSIFAIKTKHFVSKSDGIIGAVARLKIFSAIYPGVNLYEAKLGAASMDSILSLTNNHTKEESKRYWQIPEKKVTILIGYSGKRLHNHIDIIKKLNEYSELSDKIHLLAPMTRGADSLYINEVESTLESSQFTYTLLKDRFLSDEDIAQLRYATDIVFQFATEDAYSRSIIECICAGAILIYGDWINYRQLLADDSFEAISVSNIEKGIEILKDYIDNNSKYKSFSIHNTQTGGKKFLWSECIKDWVDIYTGKKNAEVF